jgi:transposase
VEHIGIDLGKVASQICIKTESGETVEMRIATTPARLIEKLARRPSSRIVLESGTESEWVARVLEQIGHEVIVADPNFAPMYSTRNKRIKTDRRDARALCDACQKGDYRPAHRRSDEQRHVRAVLNVRHALVRTRTRYINVVRAILRSHGLRLRAGEAESFVKRVEELDIPGRLKSQVAPLLAVMAPLEKQIRWSDRLLDMIVKGNQVVERLCTVPGVGPVTASAFVCTIDKVERFQGSHQLESYLGLVPSEYSSGEKRARGKITKRGDRRMRSLLVEAALGILRREDPRTARLKEWAMRITLRRGKKIATVALARRLAGILYAMWRDGSSYRATIVETALEHAQGASLQCSNSKTTS